MTLGSLGGEDPGLVDDLRLGMAVKRRTMGEVGNSVMPQTRFRSLRVYQELLLAPHVHTSCFRDRDFIIGNPPCLRHASFTSGLAMRCED